MTNRPNLPSTSHEANKAAVPEMRQEHHSKIISALNKLKTANYERISNEIGLTPNQVGRRLCELERMQIVFKPGLKSMTKSGRRAFNYSLTGVKMDAITKTSLPMKQLTINDKTILIVPIPEGAFGIDIFGTGLYCHSTLYDKKSVGHLGKLSPGNWQLLGKGNEITEDVWKGIVEEIMNGFYKDYDESNIWDLSGFEGKTTATASGHSLIRSQGFEPDKCVILQLK